MRILFFLKRENSDRILLTKLHTYWKCRLFLDDFKGWQGTNQHSIVGWVNAQKLS